MPRNREGNRPGNGYKKPGMNLKKVFGISFCIVLGVVFVSGGVIYKLGHDMYSSVNYVADEDIQTVETLPDEVLEETVSSEERTGVAVGKDELDSIHDMMGKLKDVEAKSDKNIYNILLAGIDRQTRDWNGNSDSMILVSINKEKNKVSMVSLMRDTYVDIEKVGYQKLNYAYAMGAGPRLCQTVTDNFRIKVDRYAAVDFWDLVDVIDIIGGVDLEITAAEARVANGYILDMCDRQLKLDGYEHLLPEEGGMVHCDGVQAVAYARNRMVGNSDFERTQRQRYVLTQLMAEVKRMSVAQMTEKMQAILQHVTMNIPETEIWSMVTEIPEMLDYKFEMSRVPYDNMYDVIYVKGQDMLVPHWEDTLEILQDQIYGDGTLAKQKLQKQ